MFSLPPESINDDWAIIFTESLSAAVSEEEEEEEYAAFVLNDKMTTSAIAGIATDIGVLYDTISDL
jgi:hypothetical protein